MAAIGFTALALTAFAANSVLCRLALQQGSVDPATFTTIRLLSGAAMLLVINGSLRRLLPQFTGSWSPAVWLAVYALPFAFAYTSLSAGTGALILFGAVQITMLVGAHRSGERLHTPQWCGLGLAFIGLVYLVAPGVTAPSLRGAALMGIAGCSWGWYSLGGRGTPDPLLQTTSNFVRSVPLVFLGGLLWLPVSHAEPVGALLAIASGAFASGLGYVAWFAALRRLTAIRAAIVQLAVPVFAALGGVLVLAEPISVRLVIAAVLVLGGIALAIVSRGVISRPLSLTS